MSKKCVALQNINDYCVKCPVPLGYANNTLTLQQCRDNCSNCRSFGSGGIYKFDIAYTLFQTVQTVSVKKGTGRKAKAFKNFGTAVANLTKEGKTQREIADTLGISPTTVCKIRAQLAASGVLPSKK